MKLGTMRGMRLAVALVFAACAGSSGASGDID